LVNNASRAIANAVTFAGNPIFDSTGFAASQVLSLNGATTFADGALVATVLNPNLTVNVNGAVTNIGSITSITKNGPGAFNMNLSGYTGALTINGGGVLSLLTDGDGTVAANTVTLGAISMDSSLPIVTIGRAAGTYAPLFLTASNKLLAPSSFTSPGLANGMTVNNNNGYGLLLTENIALNTGLGAAGAIYTVGTASISSVVQGLTLNGRITGGESGAGVVTLTKAGAGALVLGNNATTPGQENTFGGSGSIIDITGGILQVSSNAALGDASNVIRLSANSGTQGLRLAGGTAYTLTGRTIRLNAATTGIDVTTGTTVTLDTAFDAVTAGNNLQKNDNGVLIIDTANSAGWTGTLTVNAGAVRLMDDDALGGAGIALTGGVQGAAVQLAGGVTINKALNLNSSGTNMTSGGISFGGQLDNFSDTNTWSGALSMSADAAIGARAGSTLNITGGISMGSTGTRHMFVMAEGDINITTTALTNGSASSWWAMSKYGAGTLTIQTANTNTFSGTSVSGSVMLRGGNTILSGAGAFNTAAWTTNIIFMDNRSTLTLDNTGTNVLQRTTSNTVGSARALDMTNGTLRFLVNGGAASAETFGALTSRWGANTIQVTTTSQDSTLTFSSLASNVISGGSTLVFEAAGTGANFGSAANKVVFTTAPTLTAATTGILARGIVIDGNGVNFASYNHNGVSANTNGIQAYTGYNNNGAYTNINTAAATDNVKVGVGFVTTSALTGSKTINSLNIVGNGLAVNGAGVLTLTSGGILNSGGSNTLGGAGLTIALGATEGGINVATGSVLTVSSQITGTGNLTKGLGGELVFTAKQLFNTGTSYFTINGGKVTLNAGDNTLFQGVQGGTAGQHLAVGPTATLDLNGNDQMVGRLRSTNGTALPGSGGIITSATAASFVTVTTGEDQNWGGSIQGSIFFNKAGSNTLTVRDNNTYTGGTLINGGAMTLTDSGRLSGTTSVTLNHASLTITNAGLYDLGDRINNAAAFTLNGGAITFTGRDNTASSETLGTLLLASGNNNLRADPGGTGTIRSAVLSFGNVTQTNQAVLNVNTAAGQMGSAARITWANGSTHLVNNIIPWALSGGGEFLSYVDASPDGTSGGLGALNSTGYAGYNGTSLPLTHNDTGNYAVAGNTIAINAGGLNINALKTTSTGAQVISFAADTDVLNLTAGAYLKNSNQTTTFGATLDNGRLTAGGTASTGVSDLYFFTYPNGTSATTINSRLVDNANGARMRFVYTSYSPTSQTIITNGLNSYTGGTTLNGGAAFSSVLDLNVAGADGGTTLAAIPLANVAADSLVINNSTVRLLAANQIHFGVSPILNGGAVLNLNNFNQTLAGLTLNNIGATTATTVTIGTGVLTMNGGITATSSNAGMISTITGTGVGTLALNGAVRTFDIAPITVGDSTTVADLTPTLNITALISGDAASGIHKTGGGLLLLNAANTYGGSTTVAAGTLKYGVANAIPTGTALSVLSGAVLDITSGGTAVTVGSLASENAGAGGLITTLSTTGTVTFTTGALNTSTIYGGVISNSAGSTLNFVKVGSGTQTLGGASTYNGRTSIQNGALSVSSINSVVGGTSSSNLGAPVTVANGTIDLGFGTTTGTLIYTGAGETTDRVINLAGTTGGGTLQADGSGALVFTSATTVTGVGNKTLTLQGSSTVANSFAGVIGNGTGSVISLTKADAGLWVLSGGNAYTGSTTINGGILRLAAASPISILPDRSGVVLADVAGVALDLNGNSETFGSLSGGGTTGGNVLMTAGLLMLGLDNANVTFAGSILGDSTDGLTKVGGGMQTFTGALSFTGDVLILSGNGTSGGGLTLGGSAQLADTINVSNRGYNTTFAVNASDIIGAYTATNNTFLALGAGTTLTTSYANGTPVVMAATADSASANGRIIRQIDTSGLKVGDLISGTGVSAPGYIVQIIDATTVLVNRTPPTGPTNDFAPTVTSVNVLGSAITGAGGFTKNGNGLLILTGNSTHSGATTINDGTVQIGGIWTGQKFSLHDTLSNSSQLVFAGTGTQNLNFADSTNNLLSFERVGSLAGGSVTTTINLTSGGNVATLAFGGDNSSTTYSGNFLPSNSAGILIKEGTGTFTWNNPTANTFDGDIIVDAGGFTTTGANGLDGANDLFLQNNGTTFTSSVTANDTFAILQGGGKGATRVMANGTAGGLQANYIAGTDATIVMTTAGIRLVTSTATSSVFGGVIAGAGDFTKEGTSILELRGANTYTGQTLQNGGTLRMGVYSASAGVGAVGAGGYGTLAAASSIRVVAGTLDINGTSQTVTKFAASSSAGTIQLVNGSLTFSDQDTQTVGTAITGNLNSVLNVNRTGAASTLTFNGNSSAFAGTINVGANAAIANATGGNLGDTARINLNGTGTQLTVAIADTLGSLAGTGNVVLTAGLTLQNAYSGASSATAFTGVTSGAGALTLSNFGGLTVSGNLAHTGGTVLSSGSTLNLNYGTGSNIIPTTGALTLNGGHLRVVSTDTTANILEAAASTSLNAGASSVRAYKAVTGEIDSGMDGINLNAITRAAGGTINVGRNAAATSTANVSSILGGTNTAYATFNGITWAVANGATTAISGLGAFSTDVFGAGLHVDITAAGANAGGLAATLRFSGANVTDITGPTTLSMGGILVTRSVGANASTISGALNGTGNELIIHQYNLLGDLVLSNIGGTNTIITTAGAGRTLITNNMAGTGATTIGNGYLQLGDSTVGGSAAGMVGSGVILNNGTLGINRSNAQVFASIISGTGNIEQLGSGTTTFSAANTFQGRVTVRGGILEITNNAGLGLAATGTTNRWANLTSVNTGGTLLLNVAAGGAITEVLNLDGGTLDLRSTVATTLAAPIVLTSSSTIRISNTGAAVNHLITGEILALPGSNLTIGGVVNGTPSTLVLAPAATTGSRWENTTIEENGRLQIGNNTRGWLGTGNVVNNGTLITNTNNAHLVLGNAISGNGNFIQARGTVYLTADNNAYTGTWTVGSVAIANAGAELRIGNDTYTGSIGSGDVTLQATAGSSLLRTHWIADNILANNITLNAATTLNAHFLRQGLGNATLTGNLTIGANSAAAGRAILQTEGGGKLFINGTLVGGSATNLLNIVNNGVVIMGGSASNSYHGILSGNNVWVFDNSGTTTLLGVNTVNVAHNYIRKGTVVIGTGGANTINDDNDLHVLNGGTLSVAGNELIGQLY
ncbi:MAG: autotransporter-associated beta strand repeat-containing protein, partial [Gammaproteobacteria bacterium]|nr:autotransporter-associated beta strand repeat-containing protein [Gammaproteobacteria bacterium]